MSGPISGSGMPGPLEVASTIQAAHMRRDPSPRHDVNPSTAASAKVPVKAVMNPPSHSRSRRGAGPGHGPTSSSPPASLPSSPNFSPPPAATLRRAGRHPPKNMPQLPDLRFEQSYLASIQSAATWQQVVWITARDQVLLPLVQGTLWTLALAGWRHWNTGAHFAGRGIGARVRRWWWQVNNWDLPSEGSPRWRMT